MINNKSIILLIIGIGVTLIIFSFVSFGYFFTTSDNSSSETPKFKTTIIFEGGSQDNQVRNLITDNKHVNFLLSECGLDEHCLVEQIRNISTSKDEQELLEIISLTMDSYETLGIWCHHQGHHIGEFLLGYYNGEINTALSKIDRKCDSSLYHGVIENFLKHKVILHDIEPENIEVSTSCDIIKDRLTKLECAHGMGHGLVKASDFDLEWSANRCDEFALLELNQVCYRGVFMENIVALHDGKGVFDEDNPYSICDSLEDRHAQVCIQYHAWKIASFFNGTVFDACDKTEPESLIKYCYMGIKPYLFDTSTEQYQNIVSECSKGNPDYQTYCYIGTVIGLADWKGSQEGMKFCKAIPEEFKTNCYDYLGKLIHDVSPDRVKEECSKAESVNYQNICRDAIPEGIRILIT